MNKLMKKKFINFLKENHVYERFMYNFEHRKEIHNLYPKINFKRYFDVTYEKHLLYNAFAWRGTCQGYVFWQELNQKWIKYTP